jgi:hypothetical protein
MRMALTGDNVFRPNADMLESNFFRSKLKSGKTLEVVFARRA